MIWLLGFYPTPEEMKRWGEFVGPPTPQGWMVIGHPENLRRVEAAKKAAAARGEDPKEYSW